MCSYIVKLAAVLAVCVHLQATAGTINVPADHATIQAAIDAAMAGDEIVVGPGTYVELLDLLGKEITLRSSDGPDVTVIDGDNLATVLLCDSGEGPSTLLQGFTVTGGNGSSGIGLDNGGAIFVADDSELTVIDCIFTLNHAPDRGGAIDVGTGGTLTLQGCSFFENTADGTAISRAGAIALTLGGIVTVTDCQFVRNSASFSGGAIVSRSSESGVPEEQSILHMSGCLFQDNTAGNFGGAVTTDGQTTINDCTFTGNSAVESGGALVNFEDSLGGDIVMHSCSFFGNTSEQGGALTNSSRIVAINCQFSGNAASDDDGGAIENFSELILINCTLVGNESGTKAGGAISTVDWPDFPLYEATFSNCILWDNSPNQIFQDKTPITIEFSNVQGGFAGTGNIDVDPSFVDQLGPDGLLGTADDDLRLASGSPSIDAGNNAAVPRDVALDLDGNPRFVDDPESPDTGAGIAPIVDMGAFEFQALSCAQDLTGDGVVGPADLASLLGAWGRNPDSPADFNGDGVVGPADLAQLLGAWGPC